MTRTSSALKRLGVVGVAAVTIGAGLPVLLATSAQAAGPTAQLTITPAQQQGAAGTCVLYAVTPTAADGTVPSDTATLVINLEAAPTGANNVQFCNPTPPFANDGTASTDAAPITGTRTPARDEADAPASGPNNPSGTQFFGIRSTGPGGANIRAFIDEPRNNTGNDRFDAGEVSTTATATFTAGGTNTSDVTSGGNAAQNAVNTITEVPQSATAAPIAANQGETSRQFVTVQVRNAAGDPVSGVTVTARFAAGSANAAQPASGTTAAQPAADITCRTGGTTTNAAGRTESTPTASQTATTGSQGGGTVTNNNGIVTCSFIAARAGTDTIELFVNQTTGSSTTAGPDAGEPRLTVTRTTQTAPNTNATQARNVDLTPEGPIQTNSGETRTFTATVTDAAGVRVSGVQVTFSRSGSAGRFAGANGDQVVATTNNFGQAVVTITSVAGETGQAVVTSTITTAGTQCTAAAGAGTPSGTTAGNCSDSEVTNFAPGTASPSPSPTQTATTSPSPQPTVTVTASPSPTQTQTAQPTPSNTPAVCRVLAIRVNTSTITVGQRASVTVSGAEAAQGIELYAYSNQKGQGSGRPPYRLVREAPGNETGSATFDNLVPPTNTRLFGLQRGCDRATFGGEGNDARTGVINVRTSLGLSARRLGARSYLFEGRLLPRDQVTLVTLYRIDRNGREILTGQDESEGGGSGLYQIRRTFTGSGTFDFVARTSQTLINAPGVSNVRRTIIF